MKITISFLHLEHTPALDEKIREKSAKLAKYFKDKGTLKWSCFVKSGQHHAEVNYHASHYDYHASAHAEDMYHTLDLVIEKIERQIHKDKEKYNKMHRENPEIVILDPNLAWTDYDEGSV